MGEIIDFPMSETNRYSVGDGIVGVININNSAECVSNDGINVIMSGDICIEFKSRKEMAEWLWMAAILVDSEERYKNGEYVGLDYV